MNYDFLRRHGEKTDHLGRSFKMLDFEDGGMYFGIVQEELPSGLGAFVYSDLKFHCGNYRDGLMNSLSRIHFGNGDVYDGMTEDGKMHGEGFFFDCENNDWVFGIFEFDNCTEVIDQGDGFPRAEILKFRSLLRQSSKNYYGRDTEPLIIDLDLLIDYANRDISHLKPESMPEYLNTPAQNDDEYSEGEEEENEVEEEYGSEEMESEMTHKNIPQKRHDSQPDNRSPLYMKNDFGLNNEKSIKPYLDGPQLISDSKQDHRVQISQKNLHNGIKNKNLSESKKTEIDMHPQDRKVMPIPEVHVLSPGYEDHTSLKTPKREDKEPLKKTQGNQIVQGASMVKPRHAKSSRLEGDPYLADTDAMATQNSKISHQSRIQDISGVSSVKDRDESRDLRNISIQTEDKLAESNYRNDEASISYLKGIHSMIDDLKQMVCDKILIGRETEKVEESILFKIAEVKKQVEQSFHSKNHNENNERELPMLGFHIGSAFSSLRHDSSQQVLNFENFKSEGSGLPPETRLPLDFNMDQNGYGKIDWNMTIDRQLEEKRLKDIEDALAKRFGKIEDIKDIVPEELEPIKESADGEEGEEDEEGNNQKNNKNAEENELQRRITLGASWEALQSSLNKKQSNDSIREPSETNTKHDDPNFVVINTDEKFNSKIIEPRILPRQVSQEKITEADEKNFYMGEPDWGENNRKSSWAVQSDKTSTMPANQKLNDSRQYDDKKHSQAENKVIENGNRIGLQPVWNGSVEDEIRPSDYSNNDKALSFGNKQTSYQLQLQVPANEETIQNRESNFMDSKRGGESHNSTSLLPGMTSEAFKNRSVNPWYFLNPYLYDVNEEIDTNQN